MFRILKIEQSEVVANRGSSCFSISVEFYNDDENIHFGHLDKYCKNVVLLDRVKYEQHYDNLQDDDMYFEDIAGSTDKLLKFRTPSPYELGYCKAMECLGSDSIHHLGDNKYRYFCYVSNNYITEGCAKQLFEMKEHQENNFCRYGDYPEQVGAFRSGDSFHDFIGILETIDRFWD